MQEVRRPRGYKEENFTHLYTSLIDPMGHLMFYQHKMMLYAEDEVLMCINFLTSFGEVPVRWWITIPEESISLWENLAKSFTKIFVTGHT